MAVSSLEQRFVPLVVSSPVWSPWGPGLVAPLCEEDGSDYQRDEFHNERRPLQQKPRRSHSWGGYATHAQLTSLGCVSDSELQSEPEAPRRAMSDRTVAVRGRRKQRVLKPDSQGVAPQVEAAWMPRANEQRGHELRPVLLGSGRASGKSKRASKGVDGGLPTDQLKGPATNPGAAVILEKTAITTLAIRNLPYSLAQQDLLQVVDDSGFAGLYDFVYLPHKFKEHRNLGFAFINFLSEDAANKFSTEWQHTYRFTSRGVRKPLNISPAAVQGREANQKNATSHKMGRVRNSCFRPMLLDGPANAIGVP